MKRCIFLVALVALVAGMAVTPATATAARSVQLGLEGGYSGELDWYLGGRAELGASKLFQRSRAVFKFDWYFPGNNVRAYDFDLNYLWPLTALGEGGDSNLYIGAGLNVGRAWIKNINNSENWEFGMNLLGGLNLNLGGRAAFVEGGYTLFVDWDQWFFGGGFLF